MKDKESIIDTYSTIYYVDIVVCKYTTIEQLRELYDYSDTEELGEDITHFECSTTRCRRKSDNKDIILVCYNHDSRIVGTNKKLDLINTITHEAGHVALDIYAHMQQDICQCSSEPFCYLLGYIGECIYKTLTK